jgi:hypothetical protein
MRTTFSFVVAALALTAAPAAFAHDDARTSELEAAISPMLLDDAPVYAAPKASGPVSGLRQWFNYAPRAADPYDGFARPITNLDFHHPFIWNEIRPYFMYHQFPETSVLGGGDLQIYGAQLGVQLMPELQFTLSKAGYADFNPDNLNDDGGWMDLAFGLKYKAWEDLKAPAIASVGVTWEPKTGEHDILHGMGSSQFDFFGSYARDMGIVNLITTLGYKWANDGDDDAEAIHFHVHADYPMCATIRLVGEVNGYHYTSDGKRAPGLNEEGFDYTSLGAGKVTGHTVLSAAAGFRWFATDDINCGFAWEWGVGGRDDIMDQRMTLDMVLRF